MNLKNLIKKISLITFSLMTLTNCAPGNFNSDSVLSPDPKNNGQSTPSPGGNDPLSTSPDRKKELAGIIDKTNMTGYVAEGYASTSTVPAVDFNKSTGEIYVRTPMPLFANLVAFEMEVKKYPGIKVLAETIGSLQYVTVVIPIKYFVRDVTEVSTSLPNGNTPYFPSGEAPSKAFVLTPNKSEKIYLYMNAEAVGIFVETKFDPTNMGGVSITKFIFQIMGKNSKSIMGYISLIPASTTTKGGFFASYRFDPSLSRILAEYYLN